MITIKFFAEYQCFPLWKAGLDSVGNINPSELPISPYLSSKINAWALRFDSAFNEDDPVNSGFESIEEELGFLHEGRELAELLQQELGDEYVVALGQHFFHQ